MKRSMKAGENEEKKKTANALSPLEAAISKAQKNQAKKNPAKKGDASELESRLAIQILGARLPAPTEQHRFHPTGRWRFDLAWPEQMLAVEIQGGIYIGGRHSRANGYNGDCEKHNEAVLLGWRLLLVTTDHVSSGQALAWIERALGNHLDHSKENT